MSVSKTSKLLQYINYRAPRPSCSMEELLQTLAALSIMLTSMAVMGSACAKRCVDCTAGMRVTITDGRQMVGR